MRVRVPFRGAKNLLEEGDKRNRGIEEGDERFDLRVSASGSQDEERREKRSHS